MRPIQAHARVAKLAETMVGNRAAEVGRSDELATTALCCGVVRGVGVFESLGVVTGALICGGALDEPEGGDGAGVFGGARDGCGEVGDCGGVIVGFEGLLASSCFGRHDVWCDMTFMVTCKCVCSIKSDLLGLWEYVVRKL